MFFTGCLTFLGAIWTNPIHSSLNICFERTRLQGRAARPSTRLSPKGHWMDYMEWECFAKVQPNVSNERAHLYFREEHDVDIALEAYWCTYGQICTQETLFTWSIGNSILSFVLLLSKIHQWSGGKKYNNWYHVKVVLSLSVYKNPHWIKLLLVFYSMIIHPQWALYEVCVNKMDNFYF